MMRRTLITITILTFIISACKEEDIINTPNLTSTQVSQDILTAESIFNDIGIIIEEAMRDNSQSKTCPNYNLINLNDLDTDTLIIDFGSGEPVCLKNGKIRTGKIIVTYTGKYRDSLSVITSNFDNYYVNNYLIQGEIIVKNKGNNNDGNLCFTIDINNASITTPMNGTINWQSNKIKEWLNGQNTYFDISDDQFKISGNTSGNAVNGNNFTSEIIEPLLLDLGCLPYCVIKKGASKISPNGYDDRMIDYGDSICDCNVNIIINETNYPVVVQY